MKSINLLAIGASASALAALAGSASADTVTIWNQQALNVIQSTGTPPPRAARQLAIMHGAVYDAVNAIDRTHTPFLVNAPIDSSASKEAAVIAASSSVLLNLFPTQASVITAQRNSQLAALGNTAAAQAGIALGDQIASQYLTARSTDNSNNPTGITFPGSTDVGRYRPPADNPGTAVLPHWPTVVPFAIQSGSQFRPSGPPGITSAEYAMACNEVKAIGALNSTVRTAEQTDIAKFWAFNAGTVTPPGQWNQIAQRVTPVGISINDSARLFAMLNVSLADSAIAAWDAKYAHDMWRPVDAIRNASTDGNPGTVEDASWTPLLATPNHPTWVSGHSTFSRAGATVLADFLGTDSINVTMLGDFGITRTLTSLDAAANEGGMSRIYGGIHFMFDNVDGQNIGRNVANYVIANRFGVIPTPGAMGVLALGGLVAARRRRR